MKTFAELRENIAPKSLDRNKVTTRNPSDQRRNLGKLGFSQHTHPVSNKLRSSGYEFRNTEKDPFVKRQTTQRQLRDIDRGIARYRRTTGFRQK